MQGIKTQGCGSGDKEWTKTLQIQYGDMEASLEYITEGDQPKVRFYSSFFHYAQTKEVKKE